MIRPLDDDDPRKKIARDRETIRASMMLMDGDAMFRRIVADSLADDVQVRHRPGPIIVQLGVADMAVRADVYRRYDARIRDAWTARPLTAEQMAKASALPGDPGAAAANEKIAATRKAVASPGDAYAAYDKRLSERWKGAAA